MTSLTASNITPPIWNKNPMSTNWISPKLAMMTPTTMMATLKNTLRSACASPMLQVASRTATGVVALSIWMKETLRYK